LNGGHDTVVEADMKEDLHEVVATKAARVETTVSD
jgi:hypothetical protein